MKWINIDLPEETHYSLRLMAAKANITLKACIIKILEEAIRKQEEKERAGK